MTVQADLPYPWSVLRPLIEKIDELGAEDLPAARQLLKVLLKWGADKPEESEANDLSQGLIIAVIMSIEDNEPLALALADAIKKQYGPTQSDWPGWLRDTMELLEERKAKEEEENKEDV
jgi:hypothetical protein